MSLLQKERSWGFKKSSSAAAVYYIYIFFSSLVLFICELALCNNTRKRCALGVAHLSPFPSSSLVHFLCFLYSDGRLFQNDDVSKRQIYIEFIYYCSRIIYTQRAALKQMTTRANGDLSSPQLFHVLFFRRRRRRRIHSPNNSHKMIVLSYSRP